MLRSLVSLFLLLYLRHGCCAEEDNLEDALNAIENRQRQLASGHYVVPNKNSNRKGFQVDDDALVYLGDTPSLGKNYGMCHMLSMVSSGEGHIFVRVYRKYLLHLHVYQNS